MRKIVFIMLLLSMFLSLVSPVISAEESMDKMMTNKEVNGTFWVFLSNNQKASYIMGLLSGLSFPMNLYEFESITTKDGSKVKIDKDTTLITASLAYPKAPLPDIIKYLDVFYANHSNLYIPIDYAYLLFYYENAGDIDKDKREELIVTVKTKIDTYLKKKKLEQSSSSTKK